MTSRALNRSLRSTMIVALVIAAEGTLLAQSPDAGAVDANYDAEHDATPDAVVDSDVASDTSDLDAAADTDVAPDTSNLDAATDAGVEPDTAEATYVASTTGKSHKPVRWQDSNCIFVRPNAKGSPGIDDGSDIAAIQRSVDHWHAATSICSYIRIELQEPSDDAVPVYNENGDNENVIYWVEKDWRHDPQATGITTIYFIDDPTREDDGRILDADIELNGLFLFSTSGEAEKADIENTVVHELGHLLGLDHTCDDGVRRPTPTDNTGQTIPSCALADRLPANIVEATMFNSASPGETKKRSPEAGDILGICETYPIADDPGVCRPARLEGLGRGCSADGGASAGSLALIALFWLLSTRRRHKSSPREER